MKEKRSAAPAPAAGLPRNATERLMAFLNEWPMSHGHPDDIYGIWKNGKLLTLRKSDILGAIDEERRSTVERIRAVLVVEDESTLDDFLNNEVGL